MTPLFEVQAFLPHATTVRYVETFDTTVDFTTDSFFSAHYGNKMTVYLLHAPRGGRGAWRCLICAAGLVPIDSWHQGTAWESFKHARALLSARWKALRTMSEQLGTVPRPRKAKE